MLFKMVSKMFGKLGSFFAYFQKAQMKQVQWTDKIINHQKMAYKMTQYYILYQNPNYSSCSHSVIKFQFGFRNLARE